jgi:hypothetical protein
MNSDQRRVEASRRLGAIAKELRGIDVSTARRLLCAAALISDTLPDGEAVRLLRGGIT